MARSIHRPPFDARHEFVVTPTAGRESISVGGALLLAGQRFDKRLVDARRLRQMYEARLLAVASDSVLPIERKKRPLAIGPVDTTLEQPPIAEPVSTQRPRVISRKRSIRAAA